MNPELEDKLAADFPDFFAVRTRKNPKTRMEEGCACDDGWYEIIHDFCELTKRALENARYVESLDGKPVSHGSPRFEFFQIKQKLGTLRLYYKLWQPEAPDEGKSKADIDLRLIELRSTIMGLSIYADLLSRKTCERTGKPINRLTQRRPK